MTITELIRELLDMLDEHGNLPVYTMDSTEGESYETESISVEFRKGYSVSILPADDRVLIRGK